MRLPKFLLKLMPGFQIVDIKEWLSKGFIDIYLNHDKDNSPCCYRCQTSLTSITSSYKLKIQTMPILSYKTYLHIKRRKGHCPSCKKIRSEHLDFIASETPHLTKEYAWWIGRMCEISAVSRVGELVDIDKMTMWRLDFARLRRMFQYYKIPQVKRISVDEVYARKKKYSKKESRDKRFFTIICDLDTRRVIWVSESREKAALDEFFNVIGADQCKKIDVVAMDQHDSYKASVKEHCPNAMVVWDRFHIMQTFNNAIDEDRKWIHQHLSKGEIKRLTRGKYKRLFVKKADKRNKKETRHISEVLKDNEEFAYLELIKEGMHQLYESEDEWTAREKFIEIGEWIRECPLFYELKKWWKNFNQGWETFKNYFHNRVSSSLSEGQNNTIKVLKRRGYGYRNMQYFKLKILQVCGFLNSKYVPMSF